MDDVSYDSKDIQGAVGGKVALIDSGNTSIQLPNSEFEQLKQFMIQADPTIYENKVDGETILVSRNKCSDLYDIYGPLEFMLHQTLVRIQPEGYLYSYNDQNDCFIGV